MKRSRIIALALVAAIVVVELAVVMSKITDARRFRTPAAVTRCRSNLRYIGAAVQTWAAVHGDDGTFYPPSLRALLDDDVIAFPEAFICPASGNEPQPDRFVSDYDSVLDRAEFQVRTSAVLDFLLPLAWDKENFHGDGRVVVFFDQRAEFADEARFEELMQKVDNWIRENQPE